MFCINFSKNHFKQKKQSKYNNIILIFFLKKYEQKHLKAV